MEVIYEYRYKTDAFAPSRWMPAQDLSAWDKLQRDENVETRAIAVLPTKRSVPEIAESRHGDKSPQELWDSFWSDIVVKDGQVDVEQVKLELADFAMILDWASKVYEHATGGSISSPNTWPSVVKPVIDDHINGLCREAEIDVLKVIRDEVSTAAPDAALKCSGAMIDAFALLKKIDDMLESRNDKA